MWILFARAPRPDAVVWPGRTVLAALDAVLWPALLCWIAFAHAGASGLVLPVLLAVAVLGAVRRLHRALSSNHRYRFTTSWLVRLLAALWVVGLATKLLLP